MELLSIVLLIQCGVLTIFLWRKTSTRFFIFLPFPVCVLFTFLSVWPAPIYEQFTDTTPFGEVLPARADATAAVIVAASYLAFLLGYLIARQAKHIDRLQAARFQDAPVEQAHPNSSYLFAMAAVAVILTAVGLYRYNGVPPLFTAASHYLHGQDLQAIAGQAATARTLITQGAYFGSKYRGNGIMQDLLFNGWPFLTALAAVLYYKHRQAAWLAVTVLFLVATLVFVGGTTERFPVLMALAIPFFTLTLAGRVRLRRLPFAVAALVIVYIGISFFNSSVYASNGGLARNPLVQTADRTLLGNGVDDMDVIRFIRDGQLNYGWGSLHLEKVWLSIPGPQKTKSRPFPNRLWLLQNPGQDATVLSSSTNFGILYADFGAFGAIAGYGLTGVLVALAEAWLYSRRKSVLILPLLGMISYYVGGITVNGFVSTAVAMALVTMMYALVRVIVGVVAGSMRSVPPEGRTTPIAPLSAPRGRKLVRRAL